MSINLQFLGFFNCKIVDSVLFLPRGMVYWHDGMAWCSYVIGINNSTIQWLQQSMLQIFEAYFVVTIVLLNYLSQ